MNVFDDKSGRGRTLTTEKKKKPKIDNKRNSCVEKDNNLAVVLHSISDLRIEKKLLSEIEPKGICGSDVHYWAHGRIGPFILEKPMIIGHEASDIVVEKGKEVKNLHEGDRVAIN
uniref:Alcohol dehydrogenase-like N-terminal domain-containing protein n=1 Tax=Glossina brevipalpis TaxID=37001 RepID=A0A1A9W1L2_9MUSC